LRFRDMHNKRGGPAELPGGTDLLPSKVRDELGSLRRSSSAEV